MHRFLTAVLFAGLFSTTSLAQLSGTYTVGSGDDFETITEAVDVLVQDGTDGPVTFELNEQTFDEQVTITPFRRDSSPDDEVLFTFSAGTSPTWRFTGASQTTNWVVRLVNVEHIRFKDIQFDQPSNLDFGTIFKLEGTSDITIENNEFTAPRVVGSAHIDGNGFVNERLTIRNNDFGNGYSAILLENPTVSQFLTIRNNDFEGFANAAVRVARHQDLQLVNNDFTDTSALYPATTVQLTATEGALVQQNTFDIRNQRTAVALSQLTTLPDYTVRFENNYMFYDTPPNGASGAAKVIGGGIGVSIRHNTVLVGRNSLADVYETSTVTPSDRIENNVFVNEGTGSVFNIANALGPAFVSNYNLIHTGAGFPARYNGTSYNTLSEYQAVTGQDASSAFKKPTFQLNTDTDLRLTGSSIGDPTLAAPRISFIPGDHENNFRGATYVYKGADEPEAPLLPLAGFYTIGGTSPDFQTPDQATAALEVLGTSAQVTFNIREETYFDQTTISAFTRTGGSSDEVIFQAQTPLTPPTWNYTIPTAANNWLVRLQGVRHITFRNILFDQSSRSTFGRIFALENGANDITIEGGEVKGILGGSTASASLITSTGSINALTIQDTDLSLGYTAFDQQSGSTSEIRIENTDLIGQFEAGIVLSGENPTILGNRLVTAAWTGSGFNGIIFEGFGGLIKNNDLDVTRGERALVLTGEADPGSVRRVYGNLINAAVSEGGVLLETGHVELYHNTVRMPGGVPAVVLPSDKGEVFEGIQIQNNLLIGAGGAPVLVAPFLDSIASSDFNNLFSDDNEVSQIEGNDFSFSDHQSQTGLDANSTSKSVSFVNTGTGGLADLHLTGASIPDTDLAGDPSIGQIVGNDLDGEARGSIPHMGGDGVPPGLGGLAGTYCVGTTGTPSCAGGYDFPSVVDAVTALQTLGIGAPVRFELNGERFTGQVDIGPFTRTGGSTDSVTFVSPGLPATISFSGHTSAGNFTVRVANADHLVFDNIIFTGGGSTYGRLLVLDDANVLTVRNSEFDGPGNATSDLKSLVYSSSASVFLTFAGNTFTLGYRGLDLRSAGSTYSDVDITGNTFSRQEQNAVYAESTDALNVEDNRTFDSSGSAEDYTAFFLTASESTIQANQIDVDQGQHGLWLFPFGGGITSIVNNMVYLGDDQNATAGIRVNAPPSPGSVDVLHNSVRVGSDRNGATTLLAGTAISLTQQQIDVRNNLFVNEGGGWGMTFLQPVANSDGNLIYTTGSTVARVQGVNYATLAAYQTATGYDQNGVSVPVTFALQSVQDADLHVAGASDGDMNLGIPELPAVPTDFDGEDRPTTTYRGADQGSPLEFVDLRVSVYLKGAEDGDLTMNAGLVANNRVPLFQPFDTAPWNYSGTEAVATNYFLNNPDAVDWVLIRLFNPPSYSGPMTVAGEVAGIVGESGTVKSADDGLSRLLAPVPAGNYFVAIYHRSHLPVVSEVAVDCTSSPCSANFITTLRGAGPEAQGEYDDGQSSPQRFGLWPGDGNNDGLVTATDALTHQSLSTYDPRYDFDLSGQLDLADIVKAWITGHGRVAWFVDM